MTVYINGTTGISGVDGSAATPALQGTDTNTGISFGTDTVTINTAGTARVTTDASGNVGIGTDSPGAKLDVVSQNAFRATGFQPFITLRDSNDSNKGFRVQTAGGNTLFSNDNTGGGTYTERMRIDSSGNLLVGTSTNPLGKLTVSGSVAVGGQDYAYYARSGSSTFTGFISGAGGTYSIWASDRVSASEFNARSDARLKKDVAGITAEDAFAFIENVPAVHYRWIKGGDNGVKFGYLAQDVIKAGFPNLIGQYPDESLLAQTDEDGFTSPNGFMLTVNYDQVIPILSRAISALKAELDSVKAELATLKGAA